MRYMGSKQRIAKYILSIMLPYRKEGQVWVEPFVGGANLIENVCNPRIGNDVNEYIIAMFKGLQDGWIPPGDVSEELYKGVRLNKDRYPPELVGFVGICCSFGGKWFGGYARGKEHRNYAQQGCRNVLKQIRNLQGVTFVSGNYFDMEIPPYSFIYCDPPYECTTGYKTKFNHTKFWDWCREKVIEGHTLFVSEASAPPDFICVWEKDVAVSLTNQQGFKDTKRIRKECLFTLPSCLTSKVGGLW